MADWRMAQSLAYHSPYDWEALLAFLAARAIPGVELVENGSYLRTVSIRGETGVVEVRDNALARRLEVRVTPSLVPLLPLVKMRLVQMFDLAAQPDPIAVRLGQDALLASKLARFPGIRVPGGWDGFEIAVRAVIGQVISVRAATSLVARLVRAVGSEIEAPGHAHLTHLFPSPERLARTELTGLGLSRQKARAIESVAKAVCGGHLRLDGEGDPVGECSRLLALPGLGPWTVQYLAMRALRQTDAFPAGDLILRRAARESTGSEPSERELLRLSQGWRPWRAYAAMLLWSCYSVQ